MKIHTYYQYNSEEFKAPQVQYCHTPTSYHPHAKLSTQYSHTPTNKKPVYPNYNPSHSEQCKNGVQKKEYKGFVLPQKKTHLKYTLVLDLDETLIHTHDMIDEKLSFYTRPECQEFLKKTSKNFEIVIFTAATKDYADAIIDSIDPQGYVSHRLYREDMKLFQGYFVKDLAALGRKIDHTIIVDNLKINFSKQPENGYWIKDFEGEKSDEELKVLLLLLNKIAREQPSSVQEYLQQSSQIIAEERQIQDKKLENYCHDNKNLSQTIIDIKQIESPKLFTPKNKKQRLNKNIMLLLDEDNTPTNSITSTDEDHDLTSKKNQENNDDDEDNESQFSLQKLDSLLSIKPFFQTTSSGNCSNVQNNESNQEESFTKYIQTAKVSQFYSYKNN